jgi:flagellar hook-associated protein 3 FlgL
MRNYTLRSSLQRSGAALQRLNEKLATQKEISRPSDDPVHAVLIQRLSATASEYDQRIESVTTAQIFMTATTGALDAAQQQLLRAETLAVKTANSTLSQSELDAVAAEVNELVESMVETANTTFDGRYIFSGTDTRTPAFSVTRDANGDVAAFSYDGNSTPLTVPLGRERYATVSATGEEGFVNADVMQSLIDYRDHLRNTTGMTSTDQVAALNDDLGRLAEAETSVRELGAAFGARAAEMDLVKQQTEDLQVQVNAALSEKRDVDIAQLATHLSREQLVYQALLASSQSIMTANLMDYL